MKLSLDNVATEELESQDIKADLKEDRASADVAKLPAILSVLSNTFGEPFAVINVESGDLIHSDSQGLGCYLYDRAEMLAEVSRRGAPEIVEEIAPLTMLAIPLRKFGTGADLVAVGIFVNLQIDSEKEIQAASRAFGIDSSLAMRWVQGRTVWQTCLVQRVAETVFENLAQRQELKRLRSELVDTSAHTDDIYAELELLHRLTSQLHLSESEEELWQSALEWLSDAIPAQCLALVLCDSRGSYDTFECTDQWEVMAKGEEPVEKEDLCELVRRFGAKALRRPVLLNRSETTLPTWHCPTIRELVCVPIDNEEKPRGWLLALNHKGDANTAFCEFGSVEIQLLRSAGTILGIHHGNQGLYREQSQLFSSSVQALISAIDAKDRYTAGHSNRVALLSSMLAKHLGFSKAECDTIYLAGLLHDIGKIGVDDQVLNKPGQLSPEEFEQIKKHPKLGYDILKGVRQLDKVLPIVLHHHEAWDGSGYPCGLTGKAIPYMARIVAVVDAFDAMSSDRPYRRGMPVEKLEAILREGAGIQWDPTIIEAFFDVRGEVQRIVDETIKEASLVY